MKNAIITGANGFVGHYLVSELIKKGYKITAVIRNEEEDISNISNYDEVNIVYCDLANIDLLPQIVEKKEGSVFYHLAWSGSSGKARENYKLQMDNAIATAEAVESAKEIGCTKLVIAGSVTQLMYRDYLQGDNITPEMVTCYAIGKMAAENLCKCICCKNDIDYCWAYIANFYGEDDPTENFVNFLVDSYLNNIKPVLTKGEQFADFIHVRDVARALVKLGEKGRKDTSYYVGFGKPRQLKEYIQIIYDIIKPTIDSGIGEKNFQGMSIDYDKIDYEKLNRDTGFLPNVSFEDGIKKIIMARQKEEKI